VTRGEQAGVTEAKLPYGVACSDSESPSVFRDLYLSLVRAIHGLDPLKDKFETHISAVGMALGEQREQLFEEHVLCTRMKAVRNVSGVPFLSCCTDADRQEVEQLLRDAFASLQGEVSGTYVGLSGTRAQHDIREHSTPPAPSALRSVFLYCLCMFMRVGLFTRSRADVLARTHAHTHTHARTHTHTHTYTHIHTHAHTCTHTHLSPVPPPPSHRSRSQ